MFFRKNKWTKFELHQIKIENNELRTKSGFLKEKKSFFFYKTKVVKIRKWYNAAKVLHINSLNKKTCTHTISFLFVFVIVAALKALPQSCRWTSKIFGGKCLICGGKTNFQDCRNGKLCDCKDYNPQILSTIFLSRISCRARTFIVLTHVTTPFASSRMLCMT